MTEDLYVNTKETKKVRSGQGQRQMVMEQRGARPEPIDKDIYLTPDDRDPIYATPIDQDPIYVIPGDNAALSNTAAQEHKKGGKIIQLCTNIT